MIPIPAKIKVWLLVPLVGAVAALNELHTLEPTVAWVGTAASVLAAIELYLTPPSGGAS